MENKFQTAAERVETLRQKLRDQAPDSRRAYEAFGEAGRALDALNQSLDTAASKADQARKQMLDLAEATAEAAKAKVALDLANGRISPEQAAEANRKINAEVSAARLQAARAEQKAIRDVALARIAEVQAAEAKALAEVQKLGPAPDDADLASNEEQLAQQKKELAAAKALRDSITKTPKNGLAAAEYGAPMALGPAPQQKEDIDLRIRNAERTIATLEAQRKKMLAARAAADELVKAQEVAARVIPEQQAIAERATAAMKTLELREQATAYQAAADAATAKTEQDKARAEAEHKARILDLQIAINEARQRGDEAAAARAQLLGAPPETPAERQARLIFESVESSKTAILAELRHNFRLLWDFPDPQAVLDALGPQAALLFGINSRLTQYILTELTLANDTAAIA